MKCRIAVVLLIIVPLFSRSERAVAAKVIAVKLPQHSIRPQVKVDAKGNVHLVCGHAEKRGDLFYSKRKAGEEKFSTPIRVNSTPGCAAAFNFTVGANGRAHVLIRPNAKYSRDVLKRQPKFVDLKFMLYCRLNDQGTAFEDERDLSGSTFAFEGVGAVIADGKGTVYVFWHGLDKPGREPTRKVFLAKSDDEGKTFTKPTPTTNSVTGACACCSMQGSIDGDGRLWLVVRSSEENASKDSYVLTSADKGKSFTAKLLGRWPDAGCPGSVYSLAVNKSGTLVTWDNVGQVYWAKVEDNLKRIAAPTRGRRSRSPIVAANAKREVLFAWSEADNARQFREAGDLAWQVFDTKGKPITKKQVIAAGVTQWSFPAAYAKSNGDFVILYDGPGTPKEGN